MRKKSASPAIEKRSELFYSGRDCRAYDYMGAHPMKLCICASIYAVTLESI